MNFFNPKNLGELHSIADKIDGKYYYLAGGTDINVQIKHEMIGNDDNIIYINELPELKVIVEKEDEVILGSLTTFAELLENELMQKYFPILAENLQNFASPLLQTTATIGGNIANGSPTADIIPLLLVLNAKLILSSINGKRTIMLNDFYSGYKKNSLAKGEIIESIVLNKNAQMGANTFYKKVGARKTLTIAKVSLAAIWEKENSKINKIHIAAGSLNEYARRLPLTEQYLLGKNKAEIDIDKLEQILKLEVTPISDLRSDKEYRFQVCLNLILEIIEM
jgi:CO/xanthine dehydrogenase FAD-binding subunit